MNKITYNRLAWSTLVVTMFVIAWGAIVRATGSGAGCGSHWPLCNGQVVPLAPVFETILEYGHRLSSGTVMLLSLALCVFGFRVFPKGHRVRFWASLSLFLMLVEAAIGASLVLLELVANNDSRLRAVVIALHLVNTFLLLGALTLTCFWSGKVNLDEVALQPKALLQRTYICLVSLLIVGATGAVVALGDTLFPVETLVEGLRQDFNQDSHFLIRLRAIHPILAVAAGLYMLASMAAVRSFIKKGQTAALAFFVITLGLLQFAVGIFNFLLMAPIVLQVFHLVLADLVWIGTTLTAVRLKNARLAT